MFCGELVCTREDEDVLTRNSKKSRKLKEQLAKQYQLEVRIVRGGILGGREGRRDTGG